MPGGTLLLLGSFSHIIAVKAASIFPEAAWLWVQASISKATGQGDPEAKWQLKPPLTIKTGNQNRELDHSRSVAIQKIAFLVIWQVLIVKMQIEADSYIPLPGILQCFHMSQRYRVGCLGCINSLSRLLHLTLACILQNNEYQAPSSQVTAEEITFRPSCG